VNISEEGSFPLRAVFKSGKRRPVISRGDYFSSVILMTFRIVAGLSINALTFLIRKAARPGHIAEFLQGIFKVSLMMLG
jgi:hypothetical protein